MAGDWVKIRVALPKDPKVVAIADRLARDQGFLDWAGCGCVSRRIAVAATVAALVAIWGAAREHGRQEGDDLALDLADLSVLDYLADVPGIGAAMAAVGWADAREGGVVLPRFFAQNPAPGRPEAKRAADRERMRAKRAAARGEAPAPCRQEVAGDVADCRSPREEERREEKKKEALLSEGCGEAPPGPPPPPAAPAEPPVLTFPCLPGKAGGPREWPLGAAKLREYAECYPGIDALSEAKKALQWCRDNPAQLKTHAGMPAFVNRWMARAQDDAGRCKPPRPSGRAAPADLFAGARDFAAATRPAFGPAAAPPPPAPCFPPPEGAR